MGYSAKWLQTVYHLSTESHDQWNPEREDFPAGFQTGSHHHHRASEGDNCGDETHHSAGFHLNELAGSSFISLQPLVTSVISAPVPLVERLLYLDTQRLFDQGHLCNLFRPPIA